MFRIPRGLFSFLLLIGTTPIIALIVFEIYLNINEAYSQNISWINQYSEVFLITGLLSMMLVFLWMVAIVYRHYRTDILATALAIPAILSFGILFVTLSAALRDVFQVQILPTAVLDYLGSHITLSNVETFVIGSLSAFLLATVISMLTLIKLVGWRPLDRLLIPLQVLFLPIGIWWLQPKLLAKAGRKPVEQVEEHLLE